MNEATYSLVELGQFGRRKVEVLVQILQVLNLRIKIQVKIYKR